MAVETGEVVGGRGLWASVLCFFFLFPETPHNDLLPPKTPDLWQWQVWNVRGKGGSGEIISSKLYPCCSRLRISNGWNRQDEGGPLFQWGVGRKERNLEIGGLASVLPSCHGWTLLCSFHT